MCIKNNFHVAIVFTTVCCFKKVLIILNRVLEVLDLEIHDFVEERSA